MTDVGVVSMTLHKVPNDSDDPLLDIHLHPMLGKESSRWIEVVVIIWILSPVQTGCEMRNSNVGICD